MILLILLLFTCISTEWAKLAPEILYKKSLDKYERMLYPSSCEFIEPNDIENDCNTNIIFAVDASNEALFPLLFDMEINVIQNHIASASLDYKKVSLSWYNKNVTTIPFNIFNVKSDFDNALLNISLNNGSSLSNLLYNLNKLEPSNCNPISTYIFVSYINPQDLMNSIENSKNLKNKGSLNFIILGNIISRNDLEHLNPSNIFYWDFSSHCISNMVSFFNKTLSCNINRCPEETTISTNNPTTVNTIITTSNSQSKETSIITTSKVSSTTILTSTTTTTITPSGTCNNNNIVIAIDSSTDVLSQIQFEYQKNLVKYNITKDYKNFNLLSIAGYSNIVSEFFPYNTILDRQTLINDVNLISQNYGSSLSTVMKNLSNIVVTPGNLQSTFIFISFTSDDEINKSIIYAQNLRNKGSLNFVILGNSLTQSLQPLKPSNTYNFYFLDSNIPSLVSWFNSSMACNNYNVATSKTTESSTLKTTPSTLTTLTSTSTLTTLTSTSTLTTLTSSSILSTLTLPSTISSTFSNSITTTISPIVTQSTIPSTFVTSTNIESSSKLFTTPSYITTNIPSSTISCIDGYPKTFCDGQIILALDASDNLDENQFKEEINAINDNITFGWKNLEKIALTWYNNLSFSTLTFRTIFNRSELEKDLLAIKQDHGLNLAEHLKKLSNLKLPLSKTLSTFVFISTTTDDDINNSIQYANILKNKGTLNFIILKTMNPQLNLEKLNPSNIFYWDFSKNNITNLVEFFNSSMICEKRCVNTTEVPSTISYGTDITTVSGYSISSILTSTNNYESTTNYETDLTTVSGSSISSTLTINYETGSTSASEFSTSPTLTPTNSHESTINYGTASTFASGSSISPTLTSKNSYETTSIQTTSSLPIQPTCNDDVFFVIDARSGEAKNQFNDQLFKIKNITSDWDISKNYASIDVNSVYEFLIFMTYPNQPKQELTLVHNSTQWYCLIAYLEKNINDYNIYCNKPTNQISFNLSESNQTMDGFLTKFYNELEDGSFNDKNFTIVLFMQTASQNEIDKIVIIKNSITSINYNIKIVIIKLSKTDSFNYSSLSNSVFGFDDSNLQNTVTNAICN
ncbi:von Willebrand factor, type A domain-containing protein [Strongyloides ratti]|uniref:von Willebrand factor, type A domain-containing protein n=1 Tax=Strongyloides ratti TaxID=34506 RepID=A0A090LL26_STRRB|nr:von Willebrand factor, type A domain-containing protein [Strongyloides ratti]CEF70420.1 von Willebrand factor, type A domain-containing protein [Strongyloides ratti]